MYINLEQYGNQQQHKQTPQQQHSRPYTVNFHGNAQRPGSDPSAHRPAVKGRGGPNQGPGRGRIDPGLGLDPGSGAEISQNNTINTANSTNKTKTHKTTHPSERKGQLGRDLNIISWNIRGFHCNKNILIATIEDKQPNILLLQETLTKLTPPLKAVPSN